MAALAEVIQRPSGQKLDIPHPARDPVGEARAFYGYYYKEEENDSPDASRRSLIRRFQPFVEDLSPNDIVLDLGSGKQILEKEFTDRYGVPRVKMVTVDVANISSSQLLTKSEANILHIQASGTALPFPDNSISVGISNMAFDFMPDEAKKELFRVMKPDSPIFLNLHHLTIIPLNLEEKMSQTRRRLFQKMRFGKTELEKDQMELAVLQHKYYLKTNRRLYESENQIQASFTSAGFKVQRVALGEDGRGEKWWEADLVKSLTPEKE